MSARISSVRRVSSHIFTKNFENIERETFFSVDSCRQFPPSYVYGSPFLFPPSLSFSFLSSSCPFARKPRLRDLHRLYQFRFPLFKVPRSRPTHSLPFISVSCDHRSIANMEATVSLLYINFDSIRPNSIRSTIDSGIVYGDRRNGTCC